MKMTRGTRSGLVVLLVLLLTAIAVTAWRNGMFRPAAVGVGESGARPAVREAVENGSDTAVIDSAATCTVKLRSKKSERVKDVPERSPLDEEVRQNIGF